MDSYKRNIILLATFSIVILYMITPANADNNSNCEEELEQDGFNINLENGTNINIAHARQNNINNLKTPHGKVYQKLLDYYAAVMPSFIFCLWIANSNLELDPSKVWIHEDIDRSSLWTISSQALTTYMYVGVCMVELRTDGFNTDLGFTPENIIHANQHTLVDFNTSFGKVFHLILKYDTVIINPFIFCSWLNVDTNLNYSHLWMGNNTHGIEMWRVLVQELTTHTNLISYLNLHNHLCSVNLRRDSFNINVVNDNRENKDNALYNGVNIITPHGKVYRTIIREQDENINPNTFCLWAYGWNVLSSGWTDLRYKLAYETCLSQLLYDNYNVTTNNMYANRSHGSEENKSNMKTTLGLEYTNILCGAGSVQTPKMFCDSFSSRYVLSIMQYFNEHIL